MAKKRMKRKDTKVEDSVGTEDRISNLPDGILTHILSFLSTKDSVRTSILSTRWKPIWAYVPSLKLWDTDFCAKGDSDKADKNMIRANFAIYMNQFLKQINPSSSIRKIFLSCSMSYDLSIIESWISLAKRRNVGELILHVGFYLYSEDKLPRERARMDLQVTRFQLDPLVPYGKYSPTGKLGLVIEGDNALPIVRSWVNLAKEFNLEELRLHLDYTREFPQALFMWDSLVDLELSGSNVILNCPMASICFPNLKVLHLLNIIYKDDNSASNLINSSCPVLEELEIIKCEKDHIECLNIISHTLKRLRVYSFRGPDLPSDTTEVRIDAPALQYLCLQDNVTKTYILEDFSELVEADLDVQRTYFSRFHNGTHSGAVDLLQKISNVECLSLTHYTVIALQRTNTCKFMTFHNLTCLKIDDDYSSRKWVSWKLLLELLKSSPKLEELMFEAILFRLDEEFNSTQGQDQPFCLGHLKMLEISFHSCNKRELKWVGYFLMNCKVLKRLIVKYSYRCRNVKAFEQAVLALPRGSTECQIQVP